MTQGLSRIFLLSGLLWLGVVAGVESPVAGAEAGAAGIIVSDLREEDSAAVKVIGGVTIATIKSPRGIGHCSITPGIDGWPAKFVLLLAGFRELEQFEARFGRMHTQGSRKASGEFEISIPGEDGNFSTRSGAATLEVKVEVVKDGVLVTFPERLFSGCGVVRFSWIDWFRR